MLRKNFLVPALSLAFGAVGLLPAGVAQASTTTLPITGFYQMVADSTHSHLFLSQGSGGSGIVVTDLAGSQVGTTLPGTAGSTGMALSPGGKTLYAAVGSSVIAFSTSSLTETASYPLPSGDTAADVAVQSGKLWVSYNTMTGGAIGDIDPAATPAFQAQPSMGTWPYAPELAGDPADTGVLVAAEPALSSSQVASYDTAGATVSVIKESAQIADCGYEIDVAVAPGGSQFVLACRAEYAASSYSTADLSVQSSYPTYGHAVAVAMDANGDLAPGSMSDPADPGPDLSIYQHTTGTLLNTYNLATPAADITSRGLAWSADGSQLFVVTRSSSSPGSYYLQAIDKPTLATSVLDLSGPSAAYIAKPLTLTGSLSLASAGAAPVGTPVTITRSVAGTAGTTTFNVQTVTGGFFTLKDTPSALGRYTYTASFAGNANMTPATASYTVTVTRAIPSLTLSAGGSTVTYEPKIHLTAHLGATDTNRTVSIYAQQAGSGRRKLLKRGKVNRSGNLSVTYKAPHSTTFSAVFSGDADYAATTVTQAVAVRARVSESISGHYGRKRIGRTTYWLYRRTGRLDVRAAVAPNKFRQCVKFEVQAYSNGAWQANTVTGCVKLNRSSDASAVFRLNKASVNYHYRVRADYVSRNSSNASNDSAWQYLIVKK